METPAAPGMMGGWRPIASAPRDGTEMLVRCHESAPMPGAPGGTLRFDPGRTARFDRTRRAWITTDRFRDVVYPSAWQPMPQPPSGTR